MSNTRATKIPKGKSLQAPPPLTEEIKTVRVKPETGATSKLNKANKSKPDENRTNKTDNQEDKASSSDQVARKINSRAAHTGMVLNLNPKKVTVPKPFNLGRTREKSAPPPLIEEIKTVNVKPSTGARSKLKKANKSKSDENWTTKTENQDDKASSSDQVAREIKSRAAHTGMMMNLNPKKVTVPKPFNLGRTRENSDKYADKRDSEESLFEVLDLIIPEFSKSVSGKISPVSRKNSLAHSGIKFIPKKPKKYTLSIIKEETLKTREDEGAKSETAGDSNCPKSSSTICRSSSLKEKSAQKSCPETGMKQEIKDDSAKNLSKPLPSSTNTLNRKVNRSKTEPAIKINKTAVKKNELKLLEEAEENQFEILDLMSTEVSKLVSGKVSSGSKKSSIAHSGKEFIPTKTKETLVDFNIKREGMLQASGNKEIKPDWRF